MSVHRSTTKLHCYFYSLLLFLFLHISVSLCLSLNMMVFIFVQVPTQWYVWPILLCTCPMQNHIIIQVAHTDVLSVTPSGPVGIHIGTRQCNAENVAPGHILRNWSAEVKHNSAGHVWKIILFSLELSVIYFLLLCSFRSNSDEDRSEYSYLVCQCLI